LVKTVCIPYFLKITGMSGKEVCPYNSIDEIKPFIEKKTPYILMVYDYDYDSLSDAVKNSFSTIIVSFGCDFEQIDNYTFRVDGEKISRFYLESVISLIETTSRLYDRIIENLQIGISLTVEKEPDNLYSSILTFLRKATGAEAGTLYLMNKERDKIFFISSQNSRFDSKMIEKKEIPFNRQSLVGYVCHNGEPLNISDAYKIPEKSPYHFNSDIDKKLNYKTVSIITVPMKTTTGEVVGAVQLINKMTDLAGVPVPFSDFDEMMLMSLSTLAAVSVENNDLLLETEMLLNNMIVSSVKAIEQRDPATKGHSLRVAAYTLSLLKRVALRSDILKNETVDTYTYKTAETAALLHDFGKVGVREKILMKQGRIYSEQIEAIKWRMRYILASVKGRDEETAIVREMVEKLESLNIPRPHTDEEKALIESAGTLSFEIEGSVVPVLTDNELDFLRIKSGTFNESERADMEKHVIYSHELLNAIDWPRHLKNVPEIASSHHEKLDGSGYPFKKSAVDLGVVERILGIVDIYDALTAKDRPYKKAIPPEIALSIIEKEVISGKLDPEIFKILVLEREAIEQEVHEKTRGKTIVSSSE
jgi:HD-GYP domain-containing protein (c-di-GMP phosphodiesterase class II)